MGRILIESREKNNWQTYCMILIFYQRSTYYFWSIFRIPWTLLSLTRNPLMEGNNAFQYDKEYSTVILWYNLNFSFSEKVFQNWISFHKIQREFSSTDLHRAEGSLQKLFRFVQIANIFSRLPGTSCGHDWRKLINAW